jgi:type III restriction enzyme
MSGALEASGGFEVPTPILNSPFEEPAEYWNLREGEPPERLPGRRPAGYWYRDPRASVQGPAGSRGVLRDMPLVNTIRARVKEWRDDGRPGISRITAELLAWWERDGRQPRLFYAQREAVETIIFLTEARADFLTGLTIPRDDPGEERRAQGYPGFERRCCKMATGTGKSTVAAMLAAWSILNKQADRGDARFSDTVLVVCPNVTIRRRLGELDPRTGDASLYRTRDLVPPAMMADLARGRMLIKNWHEFEPGTPEGGGGARVVKAGKPEVRNETIVIADRMTTARGSRYYTPEAYAAAKAAGTLRVRSEETDSAGNVRKAEVTVTRYIESDAALVERVLKGAGGRQNILVINDEAHHAYRIPPKADEQEDDETDEDEDDAEDEEADRKEATVWIDGLDKIAKQRGINVCIDLSATPYYLGRMGRATNTVFPWVVSDFSLTDAIESGLVKVPQLVARDGNGQALPAYFNIWAWIMEPRRLTAAERGTKRGSPKPEAILKWSNHPIAILAGMWNEKRLEWAKDDDPRPPVFILVCKNKRIARTLFEWIADDKRPTGIPQCNVPELRNTSDRRVTIRVDTSVVQETDTGNAKADENTWMRLTLDTIGKTHWPADPQGRPIYPEGFEELAKKLEHPLHPPGRDIRCIVSVGMLTEGWDCNTVTHVVGLRPFQSQLLCEQVVGRALRRRFYNPDPENGDRFDEEPAQIFGVPFEVVPFKATGATPKPRPPQRRIHAVAQKAQFAITVPRVLGYSIGIRNRVTVPDWPNVARMVLDPASIPPQSDLAAMLNQGKPSAFSPGGLLRADLAAFHRSHREQQLCYQMAADLTRHYAGQETCETPPHALFPQLLRIVERYIAEKVEPLPPAQRLDALLAPYYGWIIERLLQAIRPDTTAGEAPELPDLDRDRPCATADISTFTAKRVREAVRSHVNLVIIDSIWEARAAELLDGHRAVGAYIKNDGLNFTIPYLHNGKPSEYLPDYVVRLAGTTDRFLIAEVKGADWGGLAEVKAQAAHRWCAAVNAAGEFGQWDYKLACNVGELSPYLDTIAGMVAVPS